MTTAHQPTDTSAHVSQLQCRENAGRGPSPSIRIEPRLNVLLVPLQPLGFGPDRLQAARHLHLGLGGRVRLVELLGVPGLLLGRKSTDRNGRNILYEQGRRRVTRALECGPHRGWNERLNLIRLVCFPFEV